MKLFELFDTETDEKKSYNSFSDKARAASDARKKRYTRKTSVEQTIKAGSFGRVHDIGDPHVLRKINHRAEALATDGYYAYIKMVVDQKLAQSNPYAPRIYDISVVTDGFDQSKYKIKIEKLVGVKDLSVEQLKAVLRANFEFRDIKTTFKNETAYIRDFKGTSHEHDHDKYMFTLEELVKKAFRARVTPLNDNFADLIAKIKDLAISKRLGEDIHRFNFMFRLGTIPQLVIVDPLS